MGVAKYLIEAKNLGVSNKMDGHATHIPAKSSKNLALLSVYFLLNYFTLIVMFFQRHCNHLKSFQYTNRLTNKLGIVLKQQACYFLRQSMHFWMVFVCHPSCGAYLAKDCLISDILTTLFVAEKGGWSTEELCANKKKLRYFSSHLPWREFNRSLD